MISFYGQGIGIPDPQAADFLPWKERQEQCAGCSIILGSPPALMANHQCEKT